MYDITIVVTSVLNGGNKYYSKVFLDDCTN